MNYYLFAIAAWLVPLLAFIGLRRWILRDVARATIISILCFTPAYGFYGVGGMFEILPLVLAMPSWLSFDEPLAPLMVLFDHLPAVAMVGIPAFALVIRNCHLREMTQGIAGSSSSHSGTALHGTRGALIALFGREAKVGDRIYASVILMLVPLVVLMTGNYPWNDYPFLSSPIPWTATAALVFSCAVLAHILTMGVVGPSTRPSSTWARVTVALISFLLLRSFVAVVIFGVILPEYHLR